MPDSNVVIAGRINHPEVMGGGGGGFSIEVNLISDTGNSMNESARTTPGAYGYWAVTFDLDPTKIARAAKAEVVIRGRHGTKRYIVLLRQSQAHAFRQTVRNVGHVLKMMAGGSKGSGIASLVPKLLSFEFFGLSGWAGMFSPTSGNLDISRFSDVDRVIDPVLIAAAHRPPTSFNRMARPDLLRTHAARIG